MPKVISAVRFAAFAMVATVLTGEAAATTSRAMQFHCTLVPEYSKGDLSKDDAWIANKLKGFMPEPGAPSLRITSMEQQIEVAEAIQTIRATCHDYRAGHTPESEADSILSSAEEVIQNFEQKLANEAKIRAAGGQVAQMDSIRAVLTAMASAGRQNALLGEDMLADAAWHMMVTTVEVFDDAFAADCRNQTFDQDIAFALERQRQLLGLPVDLSDCARRLAEATADGVYKIVWRHCGNGIGKWRVDVTGECMVGTGTGNLDEEGHGDYSAHLSIFACDPANVTQSGSLALRCQPDDACRCAQQPRDKDCQAKYAGGPSTHLVLTNQDSKTDGVYLGRDPGPVPQLANFGQGDLPVVFKKVDRPCDPKDLGLE